MGETFGEKRHLPDGEWVQSSPLFEVAGLSFRKADAVAFATAVKTAERFGAIYGIDLKPDPHNAADPNAIEVWGYCDVKPFWGKAIRKTWHLGFVPAQIAAFITTHLIAEGLPIAGELYRIYCGHDGYMEVRGLVLGPPGHGVKSLLKRSTASATPRTGDRAPD